MPFEMIDNSIKISGRIDEDFEFPENTPEYYIFNVDLKEALKINSIGVKNWIGYFSQFEDDREFIFHNVPPCIVHIMNSIARFVPNKTTVTSFYVPIYNPVTDSSDLLLLQNKVDVRVLGISVVFKTVLGDIVPKNFELDIDDFGYFEFLRSVN